MENNIKSNHEYRLLKCSQSKNGYTYHNLYLQIDGGNPIAINAVFSTRKLKNFMLACAVDCNISTKTIVRETAEAEKE